MRWIENAPISMLWRGEEFLGVVVHAPHDPGKSGLSWQVRRFSKQYGLSHGAWWYPTQAKARKYLEAACAGK